jgi:hydrogenase maturation protein HypF
MNWTPIEEKAPVDFCIASSEVARMPQISLSPDLAMCSACRAEISDPADRRYRYMLANCTGCGPRFTITQALPYDRKRTTMVAFTLCTACETEYATPADRRFHAEPNACHSCGPRVKLLAPDEEVLAEGERALERAAALLRRGAIVAVRGIGGFHLACDATREKAVSELRKRKQRDGKPFAVMVLDGRAATAIAEIGPAERALLESPQAPIVLLERREGAGLAESVAPGNPMVGLLIAYSPLHALLSAAADTPLVMTSGNISGDPIIYRNEDALKQLAGVADAFLLHDRDIVSGCDDSVATFIAGSPVVLRRSRGHVPRPVVLERSLRRRVLACGAQLNNTFCLATENMAYLSPHNGDLEGPEALLEYRRSIAQMEELLEVRPEVIAYDLHPLYASTQYALARPESLKIAVQHHHAHVVSVMAEHHLKGPVIGFAFDGTGYGTDGSLWGGELLLADFAGFERLATIRPLSLVGGEIAIRQVWRLALAILEDAFDGDPPIDRIPVLRGIDARKLSAVHTLLRAGTNCISTHGLGRYFDALGSLVLDVPLAQFQGQVAMAWNFAADTTEERSYPFTIDTGQDPRQLDLRPLVRAVVRDSLQGRPAAEISGRFHNTIATAVAELRRSCGVSVKRLPVVLTGGCFQNRLLTERTIEKLGDSAPVFIHKQVPPGDGGVALGQALIADAMIAKGEAATCA